jgi:hypothetical protein
MMEHQPQQKECFKAYALKNFYCSVGEVGLRRRIAVSRCTWPKHCSTGHTAGQTPFVHESDCSSNRGNQRPSEKQAQARSSTKSLASGCHNGLILCVFAHLITREVSSW